MTGPSAPRIAVLGGGLLGCCLALSLSGRGARSVLYDRHDQLLAGAATSNEGKIHLGYVYALDESLATARLMIRGALEFPALIGRYLGHGAWPFDVSDPFVYAVHRDSILTPDAFEAHLRKVHDEIFAAVDGCASPYFGDGPMAPPRRLGRAACEARFCGRSVTAAFATCEIAIEPDTLAAALRTRIDADPLIDVRPGHTVLAVADAGRGLTVAGEHDGAVFQDRFDQVVNGLWDGRIRLDAEKRVAPKRPWLFRRKYGVRFARPPRSPALPTVTFVLGPFGDLVTYESGLCYASWYPAGMTATSTGLDAPPEPAGLDRPDWRQRMVGDTLRAVGELIHPASALASDNLVDPEVRGGVIFAWGESDIDDPASELHQRWDIGLVSHGRYHSVDPGKLTLAPYFAEQCAMRVLGSER